jgi:lipid-binding SYLF domain-containing protein
MRFHALISAGTLILAFAAGHALAQTDKQSKQAELRKVAAASLQEFYKAQPSLQADVAKAPGYAVFTTYGLSFIIGGQGGKGLVHDTKTKKDTFMEMAQASAGIQAGLAQSKILIIFSSVQAMNDFVNKGWEASGAAVAGAGTGKENASASAGASMINNSPYYTLTSAGLQAGAALAGTKFWKDKALN